MAIINLYPPVIDTYQPAQIKGSALRIYFSISDYNVYSEMKSFAQVTISDQESNLSVLDKTKYPSQVMLKTIGIDNTRTIDKYYIDIDTTDGIFNIDKFYKVQIRFTSTEAANVSLTTPQAIDAWLSENLDYFSEWSRVTLIKWIAQNAISINGVTIGTSTVIDLPISDETLLGKLTFNEESKEYLNSYRLKLYDEDNNLLLDSDIIYTDKNSNDINEFWYKLKYGLTAGDEYTLNIYYQTNSLYSRELECTLAATGNSGEDQGFVFSARENKEDGEILIRISRPPQTTFTGKLTIKRACDKDAFTIWEDIHTEEINGVAAYLFDWVDQTVESGVLYKYALLETYTSGSSEVSYLKTYSKVLMIVLDDMYLDIAEQQLKVQFNPQVSSFKRVINEGKIETIGSQYPYIRRNAAINYAQFPISGLISCQMDENEKFITKETLYGGRENLRNYEHFNSMEVNKPFMTTIDNDFVYEKKFRDAVMQFLMDGKVKLFRSATEGNYLVRLTDVSFTPNQQLGRMIWTFSATANEVADNTIDNYYKYNILK